MHANIAQLCMNIGITLHNHRIKSVIRGRIWLVAQTTSATSLDLTQHDIQIFNNMTKKLKSNARLDKTISTSI